MSSRRLQEAGYYSTFTKKALAVAFTAALMALLISLQLSRTGHNDGWAITGVLPALVSLIFVSSLAITFTRLREATLFMIIFNIFLLLIPSIKYIVPLGIGDVYPALELVKAILERGTVPPEHAYSSFPLSHTAVVQVVLVTGMPVLFVFGSFMQVTYGILAPCIIYGLLKQTCQNPEMGKYALILSPFLYYWNFNESGLLPPSFAHLFIFLSLSSFLKIVDGHSFKQGDAIVLLIVLGSLVFTHHYSTLIFALALTLTILFAQFIKVVIRLRYVAFVVKTSLITLIFSSIFLLWWIYHAGSILIFLGRVVKIFMFGEAISYMPLTPFGPGLAELPFLEWIIQLLLRYSLYIEIISLSGIGLVFFYVRFIRGDHIGNPYKVFWANIMVIVFAAIFLTQLLAGYGEIHWNRILTSALLFTPLFFWIPFRFVGKRKIITTLILVFLLVYPLSQFFPSETLGTGFNLVTTQYQVTQVNFASTIVPASRSVASPYTTMQLFRALLIGTQSDAPIFLESYYSRHILNYLFGENNDQEGLTYLKQFDPLVLVHLNKIAGVGPDDIGQRHDDARIISGLNRVGLNILYSNAASFILEEA